MTRKKDSAKKLDWKAMMAGQEDFLRPLIQAVVQQVLEAEMDEALGAGKSERTEGRLGYRSGYYGRTLGDPGGQAGAPRPARPAGPVPDGGF
jgi:transposase-like protein